MSNQKARIFNADGEKTPKVSPEAQVVSDEDYGKDIFAMIQFEVPDNVDEVGEVDAGDSFTSAIVAGMKDQYAAEISTYIAQCRERGEKAKKAGKAIAKSIMAEWLLWAENLYSGGNTECGHTDGHKLSLNTKIAFVDTCRKLLLSLASISNRGLTGGKDAEGKVSKSIFDNPTKVSKIEGFEGKNSAGFTTKAVVNQVTLDPNGYAQKVILLANELGNQLNREQWSKVKDTYGSLTGARDTFVEGKPFRLGFTKKWALGAAQLRVYGLIAAAMAEEVRQAEAKLKKHLQLDPMEKSLSAHYAGMRSRLAEYKKRETKSELRLDTKGADNSATLQAAAKMKAADQFVSQWIKQNQAEHISVSDEAIQAKLPDFANGLIATAEMENWLTEYAIATLHPSTETATV